MNIAVITPTKDREEQLSLVIDCINNQTVKPDMWVIVDDGKKPVSEDTLKKISVPYKYIHYNSGLSSSTSMNSAKCLESVTAKRYIFFDDDDYYPPKYIENFCKILVNENEMVGNLRWTDYRLSTGYYRVRFKTYKQIKEGDTMSEWHGSGIMGEELKREMINVLKSSPTERYNDCLCFRHIFYPKKYMCRVEDFNEWSAISLKDYGTGLPGVIEPHRSNNGLTRDDDNFSFFKEKLGDDWVRYKKFLGRLR